MGPKGAPKSDKSAPSKDFVPAASIKGPKKDGGAHAESSATLFSKSEQSSGKYTTDKLGNTVLKAKAEEDAKLEAMRAAARARRAEKEAAMQGQGATETADLAPATLSIEEVRSKLENGLKLTHKEKKLLSSFEKAVASDAQQAEENAAGLSSFSLSAQANDLAEGGEAKTASSSDVHASSVSISAPARPLLIDATVRLVYGRRYGLLGPNGRGKTTLLKYLATRKLPVPAGVDVMLVEQEVLASETSVVNQVLEADTIRAALISEEAELTKQFEQQERLLDCTPKESHPTQKVSVDVWDEATWTSKLARYTQLGTELESGGADACEAKVRKILVGLGFTEAMQDGPSSMLSGGWRMRVALARALFLEPKLLLLDEPTNHLDLNAVLWLDDYLSNHWKHTLLVVSHDADFLDSVCTDIVHLDNAKLNYYSGSFSTFEGMKGQIESKKERDFALQQKTLQELKATGLTVEKAEKKALQKLGIAMLTEKPREYKVTFTVHSPGEEGPGIDLLDVSFAFPGRKAIFSGLRFRVNTHSRVAIVGPNGAGKSTLLKLMCGTLAPSSGEVSRHNKLRVGVYNQHFEDTLNGDLTPIEFLTSLYDITVLDARKYLGMFGLDGARHTIRIAQLSGGQKARVVFASLSLLRPHLLILDEPTNHLDVESVDALIASLKKYEGGVVLVSHDARLISAIECELWVCGYCPSGLRVERRGFDKYRLDVMQETRRQQELAETKAAARAVARKAQRENLLRRKTVGGK